MKAAQVDIHLTMLYVASSERVPPRLPKVSRPEKSREKAAEEDVGGSKTDSVGHPRQPFSAQHYAPCALYARLIYQ